MMLLNMLHNQINKMLDTILKRATVANIQSSKSCDYLFTRLHTILCFKKYSVQYCHKDIQINKQNKESRNKPLYLQSNDFQQRCHGNSTGKREYFSTRKAETTGYPHTKKRTQTLSSHQKQKSKRIRDIRANTVVFLEINNRKASRHWIRQRFLKYDTKSPI